MSPTIDPTLQQLGQSLTISSSQPLLLNQAEHLWLVEDGQVDLFAVQLHNGAAVGARSFLFSVSSGQAIFGLPQYEETDLGILAAGVGETQLLQLDRTKLQTMAQETPEMVIPLLESWVNQFSAAIATHRPPAKYIYLEANEEQALAEETVALPYREVLWIKHLEGKSTFLSQPAYPTLNQHGFMPLSPQSWLLPQPPSKLFCADTATFLQQDPDWAGVEAFHRLMLACVAYNRQQADLAEQTRLQNKAETKRQVMGQALSQFMAVMEPDSDHLTSGQEPPLLAACRLAGEVAGIEVQAPLESENLTVEAIAKASKVRSRLVALRGQWWQADNGPLVAFLEEEHQPVALLPSYQGHYQLVDPLNGQRQSLSTEIANQLNAFAYSFYRAFPDIPMTAAEVLKFSLFGSQHDFILILLVGLATGLLGMVTPVITGVLFDTVIPGAERNQLVQLTIALFAVSFGSALFELAHSFAMLRVRSRMSVSVQAAVWDRVLRLPIPFFRQYAAGDLANRVGGINRINSMLSDTVLSTVFSAVFSVFSFALLFYYSVSLTLVAMGLTIISVAAVLLTSYLQLRHEREEASLNGTIGGMVLQFIGGISKFRVSGTEDRAFGQWANQFARQRALAFRGTNIGNGLTTFNAVFPTVSSMVIFGAVIYLMQPTSSGPTTGGLVLSTGSFLAFNAAFGQFQGAVLGLTDTVITLIAVVPLYERTRPILVDVPEVDASKADPGTLQGAVEISHVAFRYQEDGPLILNDVSISIAPGEFVAFVGPSGSGKSTLVRLLLGFETPESGSIYFDGKDLHGLDLQAVRRQIGTVLQNGRVMPGDIFTNIIGSATNLTIDDAWQAASMAGLDRDIKAMPMGMHTVIDEGGSTFSGGQRQRLMIARAVVRKPSLLIFDEATSALDNLTQTIVSQSLEKLQATRIVIAHRLSTIVNADRIYVVEGGQIVDSGSYDELMSRPGPFATLAQRQLI